MNKANNNRSMSNLINANVMLQDENKYLKKDNEILRNVIQKATEYLDNLKTYHFKYGMPSENGNKIIGCENDFVKDLKEILKGDK